MTKAPPSLLRWLRSHRVAVLKGGWSRERPISLKTGAAVEAAFRSMKIPFVSIDVKQNIESVLKKKKPGFCFIALHGEFGEDGQIQHLLNQLKIPFSGSDAVSSSLAMNKETSGLLFREAGVPVSPRISIGKAEYRENSLSIVKSLRKLLSGGSLFVKPVDQGSAIGITRVDRAFQIHGALKNCFRYSNRALVERFIQGKELTVGIIGKRCLPVIQIIPQHRFYDFHSKYAKGGSRHLLPAPISTLATKKVQSLSKKAFKALGCSVYGRVDFIMKKNGTMVVLEVNTIPGMTTTSLLPEAAKAVGISFHDLVCKIVALSLLERKRDRPV